MALFYEKVFSLKAGVVVFSEPDDDSDDDFWDAENTPVRISFRPIELQELMDHYGIIAIHNTNPNRVHMDYEGDVYEWISDGQIKENRDQ